LLQVASSTYYAPKARQLDPQRCSARSQWIDKLLSEIYQIRDENFEVFGVRKGWRWLRCEGFAAASCIVECLTKRFGIQGITRGRSVCGTVGDENAP